MTKGYNPSRRSWIKLWVDEWLQGTTRFELSEKQRSIWIDLLAMAGKSRFPGIIASGKYEDGYRGYPISYLAGSLVYNETDFMDALSVCEKYGKIKMDTQTHDGIVDYVIHILSWQKYQSEYLRQKKYGEATKDCEMIFAHWNKQELVVHSTMADKIVVAIKKALESNKVDEIISAISTYNEIYKGEQYYWSHKWSLVDFLNRGLDKFLDANMAKTNYIVKNKKSLGAQKNNGVHDNYNDKLKKIDEEVGQQCQN